MRQSWKILTSPVVLMLAFLALLIGAIVLISKNSPTVATVATPIHQVPWMPRDGGFKVEGKAGEFFYGVSGKPPLVEVWRWAGDTVEKHQSHELLVVYSKFLWFSPNRWLMQDGTKIGSSIVVNELGAEKPVLRWPLGDWYCSGARTSCNGKFVALALSPEYTAPELNYICIRTAILDCASLKIEIVVTLKEDEDGLIAGVNPRAVCPSEDGAYIAFAAWNNGVAVMDVRNKKLLWAVRPPDEINTNAVEFSADGSVLYASGSEGAVYVMETKTGKVLRKWFASDSGMTEYGHRVQSIELSLDGRFLAAAAAPAGRVYLADPSTGKTLQTIDSGTPGAPTMRFSPDSKYLATIGGGSIKIWPMPPLASTRPTSP